MHFSKTFLFLAAAVAVVTHASAFAVVPSSSSASAVRQITSLFADVPDTPTDQTNAVESENGGRPEFVFEFESTSILY